LNYLKILLIALFLHSPSVYAAPKAAAPGSIKGAMTVSAEETIKLIISNSELVVIDARKKIEYIKGHIEGSVNILNTEMTTGSLATLMPKKNTAILFYCNGPRCQRSSDAVSKALSWGYTNVFWFRGGWKEWQEKRFPMVAGE